jgi:hypothetical protein
MMERMDKRHEEALANMQASLERIQASCERIQTSSERIARLVASTSADIEVKELVESK